MSSGPQPNGKTNSGVQPKLDSDAALLRSLQALMEKAGSSDEDADANLDVLLQQLNAANDVADTVEGRIDSILENLDEVLRSLGPENGGEEVGGTDSRPEGQAGGNNEDEEQKEAKT